MVRWGDFERAMPEMAAAGRSLIYQFGPGLGYLATIRKDGGPRIHPFCPAICGEGLYALVGPSPKRYDLLRDGRYAFHTFPKAETDDEFYLTGRVRRVDDAAERAAVLEAYLSTGATSSGDEIYFELRIERALLSVYEGRPAWPPAYTKWSAPGI